MPAKKSGLEGLAAILSALGGARTPLGHAIIELGMFVALVFGVIWVSEHGGPTAKTIRGVLAFPGFFIGFALFVRMFVAIMRQINQDSAGPKKPEGY